MVAHSADGKTTSPTTVERNKDGEVSFPNDPQINATSFGDSDRPQTLHSGYSQGGTTNPPAGDDGSVKYYAPKDRKGAGAGNIGSEEKSAAPQQKRDKEVNPRAHATGPRFGASDDGGGTQAAGRSGSKS